MKVITINVNGIRSAARKGFFEWLKQENADVVCIQETRAQLVTELMDELYRPEGYYCYFTDAVKKGYSGVAIYTKIKPNHVSHQLGWALADNEGRFVQVDFDQLSIISLYLPSGTSGEHRQREKFDFMERFLKVLRKLKTLNRDYVICGDWNIVHKEIDIKNFKSNQTTSGCLPEERAWLDQVFTTEGFVDAFRVINHEPNQYTWWSHRGKAYANNTGWRIDYQVITPNLKKLVKAVSIYKGQRFSDHAPVIVEYI